MITKKDNIAFLIKTIYSFIQNSNVSIKNETFTNIILELNGSKLVLNELKILYKKFKLSIILLLFSKMKITKL